MNMFSTNKIKPQTWIASALGLILLGGCTAAPRAPQEVPRSYIIADRQLAPEPVYNRLRYVQPPEMLASRSVRKSSAPSIMPVFHLEVNNITLEELTRLLAESARYDAYCSGLVADQIVSMNTLGTLDELAKELSISADVHVVVDHENRFVRVLAGKFIAPDFFEERFNNEHRSFN